MTIFSKKIQKCILLVQEKPFINMTFFVQGDQVGIAPRMFKALVGQGHPEFSTNRQQDAQEFLLHFINMVEVMMMTFFCCLCFTLLTFAVTHFAFYLCWPEELSVWHESLRSFPLPSGGEDRMPAVTKGQIYPASGLHDPAARSHGPGD